LLSKPVSAGNNLFLPQKRFKPVTLKLTK